MNQRETCICEDKSKSTKNFRYGEKERTEIIAVRNLVAMAEEVRAERRVETERIQALNSSKSNCPQTSLSSIQAQKNATTFNFHFNF